MSSNHIKTNTTKVRSEPTGTVTSHSTLLMVLGMFQTQSYMWHKTGYIFFVFSKRKPVWLFRHYLFCVLGMLQAGT